VIAIESVAARRRPLALANLSVEWGAGLHAVLGGYADGGPLLMALVAGLVPVRAGRIRVLGDPPTDAKVRRQVAFVPLDASLPDALRVHEVMSTAAAIRNEPAGDAVRRLESLGVEALAARSVRTLSRDEVRAVALAEALTSAQVRVLLVEEPLVSLDPRAAARLGEALRRRAREGCAVVVTTASMRDATELADDCVILRGGMLAGPPSPVEVVAGQAGGDAPLRIVTREGRALVAALARDASVAAVAGEDGSVLVRGGDVVTLARAVGRAIVETGADVSEMHVERQAAGGVRGGTW